MSHATNTGLELHHLQRLKSQTLDRFSLAQMPEWISKNTFVRGEHYSYLNHEYQREILADTSQEIVVRKCSQVGMTETSIRMALALCALTPFYTVIYTLPTAKFAANIMTTRVDPVVTSSPYLSEMIDKQTDNTEVKQLGDSFLYLKGAASGNAPISIPADHLVHDEKDFSDLDILEQYQSRLTHSEFKRRHTLSTPTQPGYGIDEDFANSRRHFNFVRCNHCNHHFVPDYYKHVRIPGYDGALEEITKHSLMRLDWRNSYVSCPSCGKGVSLQPEYREWVIENPSEPYTASGYQVSPFDAPNIVTPAYLVEASTKYDRRSQFVNFNLGLPMQDSDSTLTEDDLNAAIIPFCEISGASYVMGIDMGLICHVIVAAVLYDGRMLIVRAERVPLGRLFERRRELAQKYWPRMSVVDIAPYAETVMRLQRQDMNLFAGLYVESKGIETFRVVDKEEDKDRGQLDLRQVNINRNKALDALMMNLRAGNIQKLSDDEDSLWKSHLQDMTRAQKFQQSGELMYVWVKSSTGEDHYHHATLYASVAAQMLGVSHSRIVLPSLVTKFKVKDEKVALLM